MDFFISIVIFMLALTIFGKAILDSDTLEQKESVNLIKEAEIIGNTLMTEGHPENWTYSNVNKIGIRSGNEFDKDKIKKMKNLTYYQMKTLFGIQAEFFISFKNINNQLIDIDGKYGIGHINANATINGVNLDNVDYTDLTQLTRISRIEKNPIKMEIYTWN